MFISIATQAQQWDSKSVQDSECASKFEFILYPQLSNQDDDICALTLQEFELLHVIFLIKSYPSNSKILFYFQPKHQIYPKTQAKNKI